MTMSLEMNNQEIETWRVKVSEYGRSSWGSHNLLELMLFMKNVQQTILNSKKQNEKLEVNLKKFPSLGQFLADLCSNNNIIQDGVLYKLVMRCVLLWSAQNPTSVLEEKSTSWARSQIRKTASYYNQEDPCSTLSNSVGCNPDQYNYESCSMISKGISERLHDVPPYTWDNIAGLMLPSRPLSPHTVNVLSLQCVPLLKVPGAHHIIEALLMCQASNSTEEPLDQVFFAAVVESQSNAYTEEPCSIELSYQSQTALWKRYLPALESEIMCLLKRLVQSQPWLPREYAAKVINSRYLPLACLDDGTIYAAVDRFFQVILDETQACPDILRVIDYFHQALVSCANDHTRQKKSSSICIMYALQYRSLVNLLLVSPQGLSTQCCRLHLQLIENILGEIMNNLLQRQTSNRQLYELWLILIKWPTWYYKAIEMLLISDGSSPTGLELVCWFNYPVQSNKHDIFKRTVTTLGGSLHQLLKQSTFQFTDVKNAVLLAIQSAGCGQLMNVIQPMCLMLVLCCTEGWQMLRHIVAMALQRDEDIISSTHQLQFLLDAMDLVYHLNGHLQCLTSCGLVLKQLQDLKKSCLGSLISADDCASLRWKKDQILKACEMAVNYVHS